MTERKLVKAVNIVVRVPAVIKNIAKEMASEDGYSLSAFIDNLIRKEAAARKKKIRAHQKMSGFASMENRPSL